MCITTRMLCTGVFGLINLGTVDLFGQDPSKDTSAIVVTSSKDSTFKIVTEPKTVLPFEWKVGSKVTIGVSCISKDLVQVVGISTDILLVSAIDFDNRVEMELRGDKSAIEKIAAASKISEYWFHVMPFRESHRKTLETEVDVKEFLKDKTSFRPSTESDWGYGGPDDRLRPPTQEELPDRK